MRRQKLVRCALGIFAPGVAWPFAWPVALFAAALVVAATGGPAAAAGIADVIDRLDPHPCYSGKLDCITIQVPLDHGRPGDNRTLDIEFAVHLATGRYRGTLLYFVGGPGQAGVPYATPARDWFDPDIPEHYDIVFFDQRGTGPRTGTECVETSAEYWAEPWDYDDLDSVVELVQGFVDDCVAESGRADILPYIGTDQAVRDVELFRQAVGAPKLWIYGASYGTYIAQAYAALYPDAVAALILDGVMDPMNDHDAEALESAKAGEDLFHRMSEACLADKHCGASFRTDPLAAFDTLMATLEAAPATVEFPLADGSLVSRRLTSDMLFGALSMSLYTPYDRTAFLQALATAEHGDLVPILRMGYRSFDLDPETLEPFSAQGSPFGVYWGAFYGISCADYAISAADPGAAARRSIREALAQRARFPRFYPYLIGLAPECAFWPKPVEVAPLPVFRGGDFRTLVLAGDADAATPIAQGRAVFGRVPDASMVTVRGGPHVVFGWGEPCIDRVVTRWLVDGAAPEPGNSYCDETVLDPFSVVDVAARYAPDRGYGAGWGVVAAIETAILSSGWNRLDPVRIGCSYGGTLTMRPAEGSNGPERYRMKACGIWPGVAVTGVAVYRDTDDEWGWEMALELAGRHKGSLTVALDFQTGDHSIEGEIDGRAALASNATAGNGSASPSSTGGLAGSAGAKPGGDEDRRAATAGANR